MKEEIFKLLKDNLSVKTNYRWCGSQHSLKISILFDGQEITSADETIEWADDDF